MKKTILPALLLTAAPFAASADTLGFTIAAGMWDHKPSGPIQYSVGGTGDEIDVADDLGMESDTEGFFYAALEHPIPILPNIRVQRTALTSSGDATLTQSFTFGDTTYTASSDVSSEIVLDHTDVTLYYELLDNWVNLDLGLTGRNLDGSVEISDGVTTEKQAFSGWAPMIYADLAFDLPLTGLQVGVNGNALFYGDSEMSDYAARLSWESSIGLGVMGGYRQMTIKLDDFDDVSTDVKEKGPFAAAFFHF